MKVKSFALVALCLLLTACGAKTDTKPSATTPSENESVPAEQAGMGGPQTFKPADFTWKAQDSYTFPYLGVTLNFSKELQEKMADKSMAMLDDEMPDADGKLRYALFSWNALTKEQIDTEVDKMGNGYMDWLSSLKRVGTFGMYKAEMTEKEIVEITRLSTNKKVGETSDGKYVYYQSYDDADMLFPEVTYFEREEMPENGYAFTEKGGQNETSASSIAPFSTHTIDGKSFTQDDLKKYKLTMVNVFATWCTACVQELPDLQKLHDEMADKGVNVIGVVTDTYDDNGENKEAIALAQKIAEKTHVTYPFLIPDATYFNGRTQGIQALPETFFVDQDGNIVGDTYSGSHSLEDWKTIVEKELAALKG